MTRHIEVVSVLFWVLGALCVLGFLVFALIGVLGGLGIIEPEDAASDRFAGVLGSAMFALPLGALAVGHFTAAPAIHKRRPWGRTLGLVMGFADILVCCTFPIGTGVGIYTLIVLFNQEVARLFESGAAPDPYAPI